MESCVFEHYNLLSIICNNCCWRSLDLVAAFDYHQRHKENHFVPNKFIIRNLFFSLSFIRIFKMGNCMEWLFASWHVTCVQRIKNLFIFISVATSHPAFPRVLFARAKYRWSRNKCSNACNLHFRGKKPSKLRTESRKNFLHTFSFRTLFFTHSCIVDHFISIQGTFLSFSWPKFGMIFHFL